MNYNGARHTGPEQYESREFPNESNSAGNNNVNPSLPVEMLVDSIRVYDDTAATNATHGWHLDALKFDNKVGLLACACTKRMRYVLVR
jgi:hypothetical protein